MWEPTQATLDIGLGVLCGGKGTAPGCAHCVGAQRYQAIGIPVATLRQMATGQLLRVVHTILTILAEQVEANPPVRGEEAPGTPPGLFVGPTLLGAPDSPEADGNVMDKVGADAPCVADEPEAETLPAGEPSSSSHPSSSTPRVSGPSLPWIDVNDELEWPGGPPKYDPFDRPRSRSPRTN